MLALALAASTTTVDVEHKLPMPAWLFAVIALSVFATLLGVTYSFRSAGTKHQPHPRTGAEGH